ncbi:MAG: hypothetical protein DMG59_26455 [Acidobacteria bacterium]|nr:MAG: hypothetical protein DMG59_26455 [Acidobacteriota bacterium]
MGLSHRRAGPQFESTPIHGGIVLGIRFALSKRPRGTTLDSLDPREKRLVIYWKDENALEDLWVVELDPARHRARMSGRGPLTPAGY